MVGWGEERDVLNLGSTEQSAVVLIEIIWDVFLIWLNDHGIVSKVDAIEPKIFTFPYLLCNILALKLVIMLQMR